MLEAIDYCAVGMSDGYPSDQGDGQEAQQENMAKVNEEVFSLQRKRLRKQRPSRMASRMRLKLMKKSCNLLRR